MEKLIIETPSRIHLGFLELDNNSDRLFGSLGLTITNFETKLLLKKSKKINVICDDINQKERINRIITLLNKKINFPSISFRFGFRDSVSIKYCNFDIYFCKY